jgi:thiol-disulfide isomerase/thioredoxin
MWARLSIVLGLLAGIATAALVIGAILAFAPVPLVSGPASPSAPVAVASGIGLPDGSATPGTGVEASPSTPEVQSSESPGLFGVGGPAPPLVVPQVGGGTIDLAALRGQPVWVNFMGTYCPPCVDEFPLMNGFAARYADDGLIVLAIDVKEEEGMVAAFAEELAATFPLGLDSDGSTADRWDAGAALPIHFWIDKDGTIVDAALGGIGPDIMARGVGAILPGVTVTP